MDVNFNESFELKGWFYLPNSDRKLPGVIKYNVTSKVSLELLGDLFSDFNDFFNTTNVNCIWGIVENRQPISLINCVRTKARGILDLDFQIPLYLCYNMIIGLHLESLDFKMFTSASSNYDIIPYWMQYTALSNEHLGFDDEQTFTTTFDVRNNKRINAFIDSGKSLSVNVLGGFDHEPFKTNYYNTGVVRFDYNSPVSFSDIIIDINRFSNFLSFATLDKQFCSKVSASDGKNKYQIIFCQLNFEEFKLMNRKLRQKFLFNFNNIENKFSDIISKWYSVDGVKRLLISHLIESITYKKVFTVNDFLNVVQALDGFSSDIQPMISDYHSPCNFREDRLCYKSSKKSYTLAERLERLFAKYKGLTIFKGTTFDFNKIARTRNFYSHLGKEANEIIESMRELLITKDELRKILICCVMEFVGFSIDEIETITKSNRDNL